MKKRQTASISKRAAAFVLSGALLLGFLTGCGGTGKANTYAPPVNEDGYLVLTMPETLLGGYTAEELERQDKEERAKIQDEETLDKAFYSALLANEDGTFSYCFTEEQYPRFQAGMYWLGCLRDPYTAEISQDFVKAADYADMDSNGIPWGLEVSVDRETYDTMEAWYSAMATVVPAICLGRYQVSRGIPGGEWAVHVTVKDAATGEVILENDFPTREE